MISHNRSRWGISLQEPFQQVVCGVHRLPIDGRIAKKQAKLLLLRKRGVHVPHGAEELFINRSFPDEICDGRVLPYLSQCGVGHLSAADEGIHDILKA